MPHVRLLGPVGVSFSHIFTSVFKRMMDRQFFFHAEFIFLLFFFCFRQRLSGFFVLNAVYFSVRERFLLLFQKSCLGSPSREMNFLAVLVPFVTRSLLASQWGRPPSVDLRAHEILLCITKPTPHSSSPHKHPKRHTTTWMPPLFFFCLSLSLVSISEKIHLLLLHLW